MPQTMGRSFYRRLKRYLLTFSALCLLGLGFLQNGFLIFQGWNDIDLHLQATKSNQMLKARKLLEDDITMTIDILAVNSTNHSRPLAHRLPQCIIIGARKCGTRALLNFLSLHSKIVTPGDEMHFFSNDSNYKLGLEWYRHKMPPSRSDQITIEKTPKYFISPIAPPRVHRMNSSIKLIVILRHPTTRVISDFTQIYSSKRFRNVSLFHLESMAINPRTDRVNLDYKALQISIYHQHISRWLQLFTRSQILIVDGEALIKDPLSQISKAETFLGLNHEVSQDELYFNKSRGFFCMRRRRTGPERCMGVNKGRKHVNISDRAMQKLNRFFRPHNEKLFKLIGQRFSWR